MPAVGGPPASGPPASGPHLGRPPPSGLHVNRKFACCFGKSTIHPNLTLQPADKCGSTRLAWLFLSLRVGGHRHNMSLAYVQKNMIFGKLNKLYHLVKDVQSFGYMLLCSSMISQLTRCCKVQDFTNPPSQLLDVLEHRKLDFCRSRSIFSHASSQWATTRWATSRPAAALWLAC